jgi:hypothetical protein
MWTPRWRMRRTAGGRRVGFGAVALGGGLKETRMRRIHMKKRDLGMATVRTNVASGVRPLFGA